MRQVCVRKNARDEADGCGSSHAIKLPVAFSLKIWYAVRSGMNNRATYGVRLLGHSY